MYSCVIHNCYSIVIDDSDVLGFIVELILINAVKVAFALKRDVRLAGLSSWLGAAYISTFL